MCGAIRDEYNQLGGPSSFLLYPKSDELTNPDGVGKRTEFIGGNIYWTPSTGAHFVAHDFLTKWGENNYEQGFLKYPTTDEIVLADNSSRRQEFQGGSIYFSFATGAHTIYGLIKQAWVNLGAENSALGFPTTDEQDTPTDSQRYRYGTRENQFQTGVIEANVMTGVTQVGNWSPANPTNTAAAAQSAPAPATASPSSLPPLQAKDLPPDPYSQNRYNPEGHGNPPAQARAQTAANGCPDGTTAYDGDANQKWNCESVDTDLQKYPLGIRTGFATYTTTEDDSTQPTVIKGFGRLHVMGDHNVGVHTVRLISKDNSCNAKNIDQQLAGRCQYTDVLVFADGITDAITIVIQKAKDESRPQQSPDNYDVGLITAFCNIGQPELGKTGYCRNDFPPPFEGGGSH